MDKSDFNDLKCWTWGTRNWGDSLLRLGSFSRAEAIKIGINRRLLWPVRSTERSRAYRICNNSRIANYRFSKFQLLVFYNGFRFNCHFGLWLLFGLDTLYHPLQHRPNFGSVFLCVFSRLRSRTACSIKDIQIIQSRHVKPIRLNDRSIMFHALKQVLQNVYMVHKSRNRKAWENK